MGKPRKQTYTLDMYLKRMKEQDIRSDQDVQRLSNQWNNSMTNELIASVLNGEYIPPIILGQEPNSQIWIIDGLQRSTALMMFRYSNYRITSSIEEPVISYRAKARDTEGNLKYDGNGDVVWEDRAFDLARKTYDKLPEELQNRFDEYQIETVIHEGYGMKEISKLVRRYNNHKSMNVSQKAFTFVDNYARRIREILKRKFFIEAPYTKAERKNGTVERVVMESVMCMFHLDSWKKSGQIGAYLNDNASPEEFDVLENCIEHLENIVTDDMYSLFTSRDSFLLFSLFYKFTGLGLDDEKFADFLNAFKNGLCDKEIDGKVFYEKGRSLKDKPVIVEKLDLLETLMCEYLDIPKPDSELELEAILKFVREHVVSYVTKEDIVQYEEVLNALMKKSIHSTELMEAENKPSMIAVIAYSFEYDIDLDDWILDFCKRNDDYIRDQKENYRCMLQDLEKFMLLADAA